MKFGKIQQLTILVLIAFSQTAIASVNVENTTSNANFDIVMDKNINIKSRNIWNDIKPQLILKKKITKTSAHKVRRKDRKNNINYL